MIILLIGKTNGLDNIKLKTNQSCTIFVLNSQEMVPNEADIHSEISDTARKIAEMESNFDDENEDFVAPTHLDNIHQPVIPLERSEEVSPNIQI